MLLFYVSYIYLFIGNFIDPNIYLFQIYLLQYLSVVGFFLYFYYKHFKFYFYLMIYIFIFLYLFLYIRFVLKHVFISKCIYFSEFKFIYIIIFSICINLFKKYLFFNLFFVLVWMVLHIKTSPALGDISSLTCFEDRSDCLGLHRKWPLRREQGKH